MSQDGTSTLKECLVLVTLNQCVSELRVDLKAHQEIVLQLLLAILILACSRAGFAEPFLIVGTPEEPFKMETSESIQGIDVDVISEVMAQLGVEYDIQLIASGARIIREAQQGRIDMVLSFSFKEPRTDYLVYPEQSYKDVSWNFFYHEDNFGRFHYDQLSDLKGLKVGAVNAWAYTPEFWHAPFKIEEVSKHTLLLDMLLHKRIDLAPMNLVETRYRLKQRGLSNTLLYLPTPLISRPYFNAFVKFSKHPMMKRVQAGYDQIIRQMREDGRINEIYSAYLGEVPTRE